MRMSCNGCRVLRKGCGDACTIRPCLQWIKPPEAQANATVFLAKFYGRAGLLNLLAAPSADHLRPAVFRSLLYEACGRIVNPVYGSVGLLWSGQWQACQAAVEAVLKGDPVVRVDAASEAAAAPPLLGTRRYDIRHVARDRDPDAAAAAAAADLLRVARSGRGRKRAASSSTSPNPSSSKRASSGNNNNNRPQQEAEEELEPVPIVVEHDEESAGSHDDDHLQAQQGSEDTDVEGASHAHSHVSQGEPETEPQSHAPPPPPASSQQQANQDQDDEEQEEVRLELTLGLEPLVRQRHPKSSSRCDHSGLSAASSLICLRLQLPA